MKNCPNKTFKRPKSKRLNRLNSFRKVLKLLRMSAQDQKILIVYQSYPALLF